MRSVLIITRSYPLSTHSAPSSLPTVASSSSSTTFPVSDTPLVVHLADGTTHHLVPIDTLTDSLPPSPLSTPPIPIPPPNPNYRPLPPHLRHRSSTPSTDSDSDSIRPASTTAIDSDSDIDDHTHPAHITVSRHINPAHAIFLQNRINTPLFRGTEVTAYVSRSLYPVLPGHVIFRFSTTPTSPAYSLYGIIALIQPTYWVFHIILQPYVTDQTATLHISILPSSQ